MIRKVTRSSDKAHSRTAQDRGMLRRLKDQLKIQRHVQQRIAAVHLDRRNLDEIAFYPAHDKRKESSKYVAAHKKLTIQLDLPCLVCGVRQSTLNDTRSNRYGAKAMETHHHVIEWALADAIDVKKFNAIILPHLKHLRPDKPEYKKAAFTQDDMIAWVDHSEDNLWVLCDIHHRARYLGIHEITYPIWCPMDLLRDDFETYVQEQIEMESGGGKKSKKKGKS